MQEDARLSQSQRHRRLLFYESTESLVIENHFKIRGSHMKPSCLRQAVTSALWRMKQRVRQRAMDVIFHSQLHTIDPAGWTARLLMAFLYYRDIWMAMTLRRNFHSIGPWPFHSFLHLKLINTENANTHCLWTAVLPFRAGVPAPNLVSSHT